MVAAEYVAYTLTVLVSFVGSYFYLVIFGEKAGAPNIDSSLQRQINIQVQQIVIQCINTFIEPFLSAWNGLIVISQLMLQQWKYVTFFTFLIGFSVLMHYEHQDLMSGIDQLWRCFGHTAFYDFFVPFLQIIRVLYGFFTPLINLLAVLWYQIIQGSVLIFFKCSVKTIFIPLEFIALGIVDIMQGLISWLGFTKIVLSETNNIAVNDFNIESGVSKILQGVNATQIGMRCVCETLSPVLDLGYAPITSEHLPRAIDHGWNTIIRLAQMVLRIIIPPNELPNVERVSYHFYGMIMEGAFFLDSVIYTTVVNLVKTFSLKFLDISNLVMPKEFIFSTVARYYIASLQFFGVLLKAIPALFSSEIASGSSAALMNAFNMDDVWSNSHLALFDQMNSIHWILYLVENIIGGLSSGTNIRPERLPSTFTCDWVKDYSSNGWPAAPHIVSYTTTCTLYNTGLTSLGVLMVGIELGKELFFKSIVLQEQNVLRVMQKYDGMWTSRNELSSCEKRKERATPLNGTHRIDWTIDANVCNCDMRLGEYVAPDPNNYPAPSNYRYVSAPVYNPWCGQPTLQDQILAPMDSALIYLTHGVFGPTGIGEILQYVAPPQLLSALGSGSVILQRIFPTTRILSEIIRISVRIILSLPDIFDNKWVYYDINCGYGLNKTVLDYKYQQIMGISYNLTSLRYEKNGREVSLPTDDETLRWAPCKKRQFKFPGIVYNVKDDMQICKESNNNQECMCNYMLPLNISMPCGCISYLPEVSDVADDNPVSKQLVYNKMLGASYRWCNSNYLEWYFYMQNQLYDSMAYLISFGPWNNDCIIPRDIKNTTSMASYYLLAQMTTTDIETSEEAKHLEDVCNIDNPLQNITNPSVKKYVSYKCGNQNAEGTCKIWGNDNFFCSMSMAFREDKNLITNVQRQIHNNIIQVLGGNFNKFNFDLRHRICDLEKTYGAFMSSISTIVTFGGARGLKRAFGKVGLAVIEWYYVISYKIINNIAQFFLSYIDEIKQQMTKQKSPDALRGGLTNHVKQFMKSTIHIMLDTILLVVEAFGDFFDVIKPNAGDFFREISSVLKMLSNALVGTFMDILGTLIDLIVELIAFFSGKGNVGTFLSKFFSFAFKFFGVITSKLTQVLKGIFMLLGPTIGGFLNTLMSGFCSAINTVICGLTFGANCHIMTCVSGGFGNPEGQPLGSSYQSKHGQDLPRLFANHYHTVDGIPAPKWVAENIDWNGTSKCDLFVEGVKFYNYTEMRPLERATWFECLELRAIGNELDKMIDIPELKLYDVLYNHKRKWHVAYHIMQMASIVSKIYIRDGTIHPNKLRKELQEINIRPEGLIKVYNKGFDLFNSFISEVQMSDVIHEIMKSFDQQYDKPGRISKTATVYKASSNLGKATSNAMKQWKDREIAKKGWKAFDAMNEDKQSIIKKMFMSETNVLGLPHQIKRSIQLLGKHVRRTHKLTKPLNINVTFPDSESVLCPDPKATLCFRCTVLDNFLEAVRDWSVAYGRFMTDVYATELQNPDPTTGFIQPGTLADTGDYFVHMFTNNSGFVDTTQRLTRSKSKLHRTFNPIYNSTTVALPKRWYAVGRDWNYLFQNISKGIQGDNVDLNFQMKKLTFGIKKLLSETKNNYVPFFGYGAPYTITYVLTESCDIQTAVWNQNSSQSDRLSAIDNALLTCLIITVVLMYNGLWSVAPLGILVNTIVLGWINGLLYLWIVYGYLPSCLPTMPHMLMEDILEWVQQRISPGCFCEAWPVLSSEWCNPSTCYQCDIAAGQYKNCLEHLPLADKWGVWWILPMGLRWLWPESIGWLAETGIIQEGDVYIRDVIFDAYSSPNGTSSLTKECVLVTGGDFFINGVVIVFFSALMTQILLALIKFIVNMGLLLWQVILLCQWTALAIEQSTRVDADETEESDEIYSG